MLSQWSYLVVVLCVSLTSSAVLDFQGNAANRYGDELSDVRGENLTPPIDVGKTIAPLDRVNDAICRELCKKGDGGNACLCDWPPLKKEVIFSLKALNKEKPLNFIKFPTPKLDPVCQVLCRNGDEDHFCWCD